MKISDCVAIRRNLTHTHTQAERMTTRASRVGESVLKEVHKSMEKEIISLCKTNAKLRKSESVRVCANNRNGTKVKSYGN